MEILFHIGLSDLQPGKTGQWLNDPGNVSSSFWFLFILHYYSGDFKVWLQSKSEWKATNFQVLH